MIENYIDRLLMPLTALTIFLLLFSTKVSSQQLHQNCSTSASSFDWDRTPNNNSQFDWPDGNLTNTLNNISGSGVNMTFTVSGDTDSLEAWQGSSTTSDLPAVGTDANGTDLLQLYTSGFSSASGVTITINFSEPVYAAGFDFAHVNASGPSGDKLVVTAKDNLNKYN